MTGWKPPNAHGEDWPDFWGGACAFVIVLTLCLLLLRLVGVL